MGWRQCAVSNPLCKAVLLFARELQRLVADCSQHECNEMLSILVISGIQEFYFPKAMYYYTDVNNKYGS
jgi:hypothetical protein